MLPVLRAGDLHGCGQGQSLHGRRAAEGGPDLRARIHPRRTQRAGSPEAGGGDGRSLAKLSGLPKRDVWVYVTEIPARQMAEYGHVLPEPGDEQMWLDGLPAEDRAYMQGVGE